MGWVVFAVVTALAAPREFAAGPVETIAEGCQFTEGPVWLPEGAFVYTDIPADRIYRAPKQVFREGGGRANGLTLDREGRLLTAEHQGRRVSRVEKDGKVVTVADRYEGKRLNSPNDVIVRSDGTVYFTDPPYGLEGGLGGPKSELGFCGVYAVSPAGTVSLLTKEFGHPNGLALSVDEKTLYVADSEADFVQQFTVAPEGTTGAGRLFCMVPNPDGLKVDVEGNVWITAEDGVRVVSAAGALLATLEFPKQPSNCAFGGTDGKTLFVTAREAVYQVPVVVQGLFPAKRLQQSGK